MNYQLVEQMRTIYLSVYKGFIRDSFENGANVNAKDIHGKTASYGVHWT